MADNEKTVEQIVAQKDRADAREVLRELMLDKTVDTYERLRAADKLLEEPFVPFVSRLSTSETDIESYQDDLEQWTDRADQMHQEILTELRGIREALENA